MQLGHGTGGGQQRGAEAAAASMAAGLDVEAMLRSLATSLETQRHNMGRQLEAATANGGFLAHGFEPAPGETRLVSVKVPATIDSESERCAFLPLAVAHQRCMQVGQGKEAPDTFYVLVGSAGGGAQRCGVCMKPVSLHLEAVHDRRECSFEAVSADQSTTAKGALLRFKTCKDPYPETFLDYLALLNKLNEPWELPASGLGQWTAQQGGGAVTAARAPSAPGQGESGDAWRKRHEAMEHLSAAMRLLQTCDASSASLPSSIAAKTESTWASSAASQSSHTSHASATSEQTMSEQTMDEIVASMKASSLSTIGENHPAPQGRAPARPRLSRWLQSNGPRVAGHTKDAGPEQYTTVEDSAQGFLAKVSMTVDGVEREGTTTRAHAKKKDAKEEAAAQFLENAEREEWYS